MWRWLGDGRVAFTSSLLDSSGMWEEASEAGGGSLRLDMVFFIVDLKMGLEVGSRHWGIPD